MPATRAARGIVAPGRAHGALLQQSDAAARSGWRRDRRIGIIPDRLIPQCSGPVSCRFGAFLQPHVG
ncbi:MAG TPA: hypothetical protein PLF73_02380, partial [Luteimonas sp.]|nr:hypothetical protein [Luteimonas sp.]